MEKLIEKVESGQRITAGEALSLFDYDLISLGKLADSSRRCNYPGEEVGVIVDRIVNYTNICDAKCAFCAFHAKADRIEPYELSMEDILQKVEGLVAGGGSQVMLQGGLHPENSLSKFVGMVGAVKKRYPDLFLHSFSPSEIIHIAKKEGLSLEKIVGELQRAGLDSIPGASDLLVPRLRGEVSPNKATVTEWQRVMEVLGSFGMKSSATMTYGMGETRQERIEHLGIVRQTQDKTGVVRAFIPWSFSPNNTRLSHLLPATGVEYLKMVAIGRIFLDNVQYIQAGWLTEGMKLAQLALTMGANDMGGILMEEVVVKATGIESSATVEEFAHLVRNAGKKPILRNSAYQKIKDL